MKHTDSLRWRIALLIAAAIAISYFDRQTLPVAVKAIQLERKKHARVKTKDGFRELGILKATTVHQEFRVLRRALNVAVRKKFLPANRRTGVPASSFLCRSAVCSSDRVPCAGPSAKRGSDYQRDKTACVQTMNGVLIQF